MDVDERGDGNGEESDQESDDVEEEKAPKKNAGLRVQVITRKGKKGISQRTKKS